MGRDNRTPHSEYLQYKIRDMIWIILGCLAAIVVILFYCACIMSGRATEQEERIIAETETFDEWLSGFEKAEHAKDCYQFKVFNRTRVYCKEAMRDIYNENRERKTT